MMTAKEARKITDEVHAAKAKAHEEEFNLFFSETVEPAVTIAAKKGKGSCQFSGSYLFTAEETADRLTALGYTVNPVEGFSRNFVIHW